MLFKALINEDDPVNPFFVTYWARGEHMGEAIDKMREAAVANGLGRPVFTECGAIHISDVPEELIAVRDNPVFWVEGRVYYPPTKSFHLPYGIVPARHDGEKSKDAKEPKDIQAGFSVALADGMTTIEVNVDDEDLEPLYFELLSELGDFRVFWYRLHDHWLAGMSDAMYVNDALSTAEAIIDHLETHRADSLHNGHVSLTAYYGDGNTNVNISDHKKLVVLTYSADVAAGMLAFLDSKGYQELKPFLTIDTEMYHWHYRPSTSRGREELEQHLLDIGFSPWQPGERST